MRLHEDFTRCQCGHAFLKKEVFVLAKYTKESKSDSIVNFNELPEQKEIHYTCGNCEKLIFVKRE